MRKLKPTFLAVVAGAVAAAFAYCALTFCVILAWGDMDAHPIAFPGSFSGGFGCLCVFFLLMFWYIRSCRGQQRRWLYVLDAALFLGSLPVFSLFWNLVYHLLKPTP